MRCGRVVCGILLALGVAGCPAPGPPAPDSCSQLGGGVADSIEVGAAGGDELSGGDAPFVPLAAGAKLDGVHGGQGAFMVGWRFRLRGADISDCQQIALTVQPEFDADMGGGGGGGYPVAQADRALRTYADADGARVTKPLWLPGDYFYGPTLTATARGGYKTVTVDALHVR